MFTPPKKKPEDDPVLDRMIKDMARHETTRLNSREISIQNQEDNARQSLINMEQLGPMEILAFEEELVEIAEQRKQLKAERKDVARMRTQKSMALLYQGEDAISKIRAILGTTSPNEAKPGTVRSDFGLSLMRNAAHASDNPEDAARERAIVALTGDERDCEFKEIIDAYLADEPLPIPIPGGDDR